MIKVLLKFLNTIRITAKILFYLIAETALRGQNSRKIKFNVILCSMNYVLKSIEFCTV
jgi:hypothetical protein